MPRGIPKKPRTAAERSNSAKREKKRQGTHIDWKEVEEWLECGGTGTQIAEAIGIHEDTLYRRCQEDLNIGFAELRNKKRAIGDFKLLKTQHVLAYEKNCMMLIWLGKNRLQQRDTPLEVEVSKESVENFKAIAAQLKSLQEKKNEEINE